MNCNPERYNCLDDVGAIYLLLGPACNMTCRHCTQTPVKNNIKSVTPYTMLSKDVVKFIKLWECLPWRFKNKRRIYFWGGEPLLYWNTIKELVNIFRHRNVEFKIYTNGLLINEDIVNFCNENDIFVIMSYDFPNPIAVRNTYPNKDIIDLFLKIKKRAINTVFNAINIDLVEAFISAETLFPYTEISLGFINVLWDIPKDIYAFKKDDIRKSIKKFKEFGKQDKWANLWLRKKINRVFPFNADDFFKHPYPPCRPGLVSLSIDFEGNIKRCHNDCKILANVNDTFDIIQKAHEDEWARLLPHNCIDCKYINVCRSVCPIALKTEDKREFIQCSYLRDFWDAILE